MMKRRQRLKSGILPERLRERAGNLAYVMRPDEASGLCGHGTGGERMGGRAAKDEKKRKKVANQIGKKKKEKGESLRSGRAGEERDRAKRKKE